MRVIFFCLLMVSFAAPLWASGPEKAHDFSLQGADGKVYALSDYRGKVVLINFMSTTCRPCVDELPSLAALSEKLREKGLVVLAVTTDNEKTLKKFLAKSPLPFPVLKDPWKEVSMDFYGVLGLPATVIIDRDGFLEEQIVGQRNWAGEEEMKRIEDLLKGK
jgi:peroxiredoxin